MSFNLGDSSDQISTAGEFSVKEDQNSKGSVIYSATGDDNNDDDDDNNNNNNFSKSTRRQETPLNRILFSDNHLSYNRLLVLIQTQQTEVTVELRLNGFRQPPPLLKGLPTPSQEARI